MSEYTNYFVVKSHSEEEVKEKLNEARIVSIIDADQQNYWFSDFKREGQYEWVTISAPAESSFVDGQFFYKDRFEDIIKIFETCLHFFQEENLEEWSLKIKFKDLFLEKKFAENVDFNEEEKKILSACFGKTFSEFEGFLEPGKASKFLNFVGIPYIALLDQNQLLHLTPKGQNYAQLASEVED